MSLSVCTCEVCESLRKKYEPKCQYCGQSHNKEYLCDALKKEKDAIEADYTSKYLIDILKGK